MSLITRILLPAVIIGITAFFYEVQAAPTDIAIREEANVNTTAIDILSGADRSFRVKRQGGGCGCGCGCGGGCGCGCCCCRPRCCCRCTTCRTCCCTRCCTCCRPCCCGCGCGCCGCGGGGRKRRSLDNLRIRLGMKQSAEEKKEELAAHELPRDKRNVMCNTPCVAPVGAPASHEIYGDY
ncbi:hypothetical protein Aduo_006446 [Ancylostoma duodenale]